MFLQTSHGHASSPCDWHDDANFCWYLHFRSACICSNSFVMPGDKPLGLPSALAMYRFHLNVCHSERSNHNWRVLSVCLKKQASDTRTALASFATWSRVDRTVEMWIVNEFELFFRFSYAKAFAYTFGLQQLELPCRRQVWCGVLWTRCCFSVAAVTVTDEF